MTNLIKTPAEIEILATGGKKLAVILQTVSQMVEPGVVDTALDALAIQLIKKAGATSTFKGFQGYPTVSCISINDEVVHGIPRGKVIQEGDVVGIDLGLRYQGFCTDMATTLAVGKISHEKRQLIDVTEQALIIGLEPVKPGNHIGDIGFAIQSFVEEHGFGIVRDLTGHGIGREPHEQPAVPNFGRPGQGTLIKEGMVLAVEPMVTLGKPTVRQLQDGWTIATLDGSPAAHFEHTVAVTKNGYKILTQ